MKVKKLVDFCPFERILNGIPLLRDFEFFGKILQDGMAFGQSKSIISVEDGWDQFHGVDLLELWSVVLYSRSNTAPLINEVSMIWWGILTSRQKANTALDGWEA